MRPAGLEILELDTMGSDYVRARVALDGQLAVPFEFAKSDFIDMQQRDGLEPFLARQARTLIDSYGDARENRPSEFTD
jgi:hypothetical protein